MRSDMLIIEPLEIPPEASTVHCHRAVPHSYSGQKVYAFF